MLTLRSRCRRVVVIAIIIIIAVNVGVAVAAKGIRKHSLQTVFPMPYWRLCAVAPVTAAVAVVAVAVDIVPFGTDFCSRQLLLSRGTRAANYQSVPIARWAHINPVEIRKLQAGRIANSTIERFRGGSINRQVGASRFVQCVLQLYVT